MSRNFTSRWRNGRRAASRAPWATPVRVRLPPSVLRRRVAQLRRAPVLQTGSCWFESSLAYHVVEAQSVERPPETRGVAGSTPADHTARLRSSRESSRLLPGEALVGTRPGSPSGRTAMGAVSRLENGWVLGPWGFDSLSFRLRRHGRAGKAARCYRAGGHSRSQVRVLLPPSPPRSSAARAVGFEPTCARSIRAGAPMLSRRFRSPNGDRNRVSQRCSRAKVLRRLERHLPARRTHAFSAMSFSGRMPGC